MWLRPQESRSAALVVLGGPVRRSELCQQDVVDRGEVADEKVPGQPRAQQWLQHGENDLCAQGEGHEREGGTDASTDDDLLDGVVAEVDAAGPARDSMWRTRRD